MPNRRLPGPDLTPIQRRARDAFRVIKQEDAPTEAELERQAFDENRERLKAARLAREAASKLDD